MKTIEDARNHCRFVGEGIEKDVAAGGNLGERFEGTPMLRFKVEHDGGKETVVGGELGGGDMLDAEHHERGARIEEQRGEDGREQRTRKSERNSNKLPNEIPTNCRTEFQQTPERNSNELPSETSINSRTEFQQTPEYIDKSFGIS